MVATLKRAVLVPALLGVTAFALADCTTYGTGVNPGVQTMNDIGGLVDFSGGKKSSIDYHPRPPLAAPPSGVAPPTPGSGAGVASAGDWPHDPDVAAQAAKAAAAKKKNNGTYDPAADAYDPHLVIPVQSSTNEVHSGKHWQETLNTKEQDRETAKRMAMAKNSLGVDANGNPIRRTLSDPPIAYRAPDPSAPTEFKSKKKSYWPWHKASPDDSQADGLVDDSRLDNPQFTSKGASAPATR
jgi:hypothetical protein